MINDLRFALRLLTKSPGFALAAILALGFGIGLSTAMFNAFSGTFLRPFPHIKNEDRLVFLNSQHLKSPDGHYDLSLPDFLDLRAQSKTLEGFTTAQSRTMIFTGGDAPERVYGAAVSVEGFDMLGVVPVRGRLFTPADGQPDAEPVALLSHGLWQRRFGGRDDIIGQAVPVNGAATTIIGVLPPGFRFPDRHDMWMPFIYEPKPEERGSHYLPGWARLRPGVTLDAARAEIAGISAQLALAHQSTNEGKTLTVRLAREEATEDVALLFRLMLGAAIFVLLIACANVANLLLARAAGRSHEIAIRVSVGATRGRVIRQVLTESLVLGVLGGAFGLIVAVWTNGLVFAAVPEVQIPFWMTFGFDWRVFSFAAVAALGSSLVFGLFPALQVSRNTAHALRESGRATTAGRRARLVRQGLVVAQIALSAVLLIGAGLFVRSFLKIQSTHPGFDPSGVITFRVGLPQTQFKDKEQVRSFFDRLGPALADLPGVKAAGAAMMLPGSGDNTNLFRLEGQPVPASHLEYPRSTFNVVSGGYFAAMRIPLIRGRWFEATDTRDKPRVAVVDQVFADRWFPGQDPIGKRISLGQAETSDTGWSTIVGIVGHVPQQLDRPNAHGVLYHAHGQGDQNFVSYALHVTGDPGTYGKAIQAAVSSVLPDIPIYSLHTMEYLHEIAYWERQFYSQVFGAFGIGALFLAALGVYSVMAYSVTQRTQEIGVRMALGASESEVLRLVGRQGAWLVLLGMGLGIASALGLTRLMANLLYGISPSDPPTYFVLTIVLAATGLVACWLPARRAIRVDPMIALRAE